MFRVEGLRLWGVGFKGLGLSSCIRIVSEPDIGPFWDDVVSKKHFRHKGVRAKGYLNPPKMSEIMPQTPKCSPTGHCSTSFGGPGRAWGSGFALLLGIPSIDSATVNGGSWDLINTDELWKPPKTPMGTSQELFFDVFQWYFKGVLAVIPGEGPMCLSGRSVTHVLVDSKPDRGIQIAHYR